MGDRFHNRHQSRKTAAADRQMLDNTQEKVLLEWIDHSAISGKPFHAGDLHARAKDLSGNQPGRHWGKHFKQRHADILVCSHNILCSPATIPMHAQPFHPTSLFSLHIPTVQSTHSLVLNLSYIDILLNGCKYIIFQVNTCIKFVYSI